MKILLIHNFYQQKGGEDTVFNLERDLLSKSEDIHILTFKNQPGWRGGLQYLFSIWNIFAAIRLKKIIREFQPEIIHIHNWHFAIGPIAIRVAKNRGIPVVITLHNYRLLCPSTTLLHQGKLFTHSLDGSFPWRAVRNGVYRNSYFQTFILAFVNWFHKKIGTWQKVDKYIVLTQFAKELFANSSFGISIDKFVVKPNFVNSVEMDNEPIENNFLFIGRLSEEKGINVLLEAFKGSNRNLLIAGDGPLKEVVCKTCEKYSNIAYLGNLTVQQVQKSLRKSSLLIFPSIWFEGMPMTIIEAFSLGVPVIASNLGAMKSMIHHGYNGLHFEAGNSSSLKDQLKYWETLSLSEQNAYRKNAFLHYQNHYTPETNKAQLLKIYHELL